MKLNKAIDRAMMEICKCDDGDMRHILRNMQFSIVERIQFFMEDVE